jgi:hypothetical protein
MLRHEPNDSPITGSQPCTILRGMLLSQFGNSSHCPRNRSLRDGSAASNLNNWAVFSRRHTETYQISRPLSLIFKTLETLATIRTQYDERTVESEVARVFSSAADTAAATVFDDLSRPRYEKLWRISVLRLVVSFRCRIAILCLSAHGIWYLVAGRRKLQRHWQLLPLVSAVVLPIKSSRLICTRSSCVRNARNVAGALRPLPNRSRKPLLFVTELLQSLENGHANERAPRRNRSQQRKIRCVVADRSGAISSPRRQPWRERARCRRRV